VLATTTARLFQDGQVILMDGGSTNLLVARSLLRTLKVTVASTSPVIALAPLLHPQVEIVLLGGRLDRKTETAIGIAIAAALRGVRADVCLLGVCSLDVDIGITAANSEAALIKRLMID